MNSFQQFLSAKIILAGDIVPQFQFSFFIQAGLRADSFEIFQISYTDLKIRQSGMIQRLNSHSDHFCIRLHGAVSDQLCPHLSHFLQFALQFRCVCECIPLITKPDRHIFFHKIFCRTSGNGWRKVRPQDKCIPFFVKEFIKFLRRRGAHFPGKHIKKFECGCLNVAVAVSPYLLV